MYEILNFYTSVLQWLALCCAGLFDALAYLKRDGNEPNIFDSLKKI